MPEVFGVSGVALRERVGILSQVVRVDSFTENEGPACGTRRMRMINGGGLEIELHPDRALDIGRVTIDGRPLSWISPTEIGSPHDFEPTSTGWLRTFGGGLMATCGLDTFGPPGADDGVELPMHGRIGTGTSRIVRTEATEEHVLVEAVVRQATVFGENLVLRRVISSPVGSTELRVDDIVTNEGFDDTPHMILYHCNLGWPLLGEEATLDIPSQHVEPRDDVAARGVGRWAEFGPPTTGWSEQVFRHDLAANAGQRLRVINPANGMGLEIRVDGVELPHVYQWKMTGQGHYVLGLEPSNCGNVFGRAAARAAGVMPILGAGDSASYSLVFSATIGAST